MEGSNMAISKHSSRWLALAAGTALTLASAGAFAADGSTYDPGTVYPSATPPYPTAEYQTTTQPATVYVAPGTPVAVYPSATPVTVYPSPAPVTVYPPAAYPATSPSPALSTPTYSAPIYPAASYRTTAYRPYVTVPPANAKAALREMQLAQEHAVYVVHAPTLDAARTQLHAVVNCIAGPNAPEFNPNVANPCDGIGAGALVDANDTSRLPYTRDALAYARNGLQTNDLAVMKQAAIDTINSLRLASM
jgi:hypothetical protein